MPDRQIESQRDRTVRYAMSRMTFMLSASMSIWMVHDVRCPICKTIINWANMCIVYTHHLSITIRAFKIFGIRQFIKYTFRPKLAWNVYGESPRQINGSVAFNLRLEMVIWIVLCICFIYILAAIIDLEKQD